MNVFEAGVTIYLVDRVSGALGQIARQFTSTQTAAQALNKQLKAISGTFQSGLLVAAGGMALAMPLIGAAKAAMDLQTAMGRVQIATGASNAEMAQLNKTLTLTANATGIFSKPTLAAFSADMYASGISQMKQINDLLPLFAKGADLMKIISHGKISPEDAAHTFSALAHQFGRYDAASMKPIVEAAVAIAPSLPGGLRTLKGMGSYVNVMGNRALGIDPVKLMSLEAAIAQTSGGAGSGRGGLSGAMLIAALKRSMPGVFGAGLLTGKSAFSAEVMGLSKGGVSTVFNSKTGHMDIEKLIDVLSRFQSQSSTQIANAMLAHAAMLGKKEPEEREFLKNFLNTPGAPKAQLVTSLLSSQAGGAASILQLFGDEKFKTLLKSIEARVKASKGIEAMQEQAMTMLSPQLLRVQTNFTTLASTIGKDMIPSLTMAATKLGDLLDKMNSFAEKHPRIVQTAVGMLGAASALMILGGSALMIKSAFMGLQLIFGPVGTAIGMLATKVFPMLLPLLSRLSIAFFTLNPWIFGLVMAATTLIIVIKEWDSICSIAAAAAKAFGGAIAVLANALGINIGKIGRMVAAMPMMSDIGLGMMQAATKMAQESAAKQASTKPIAATPSKSAPPANVTLHQTVNVNGAGDPKKVADHVVRAMADGIARAGAAASRAGGVHKSQYAMGGGT